MTRLLLLLVLLLVSVAPAQAATFWDDNFTGGLVNWNLDGCTNGGNPPADPFFGCNPVIVTNRSHSAVHSLKTTFHPTNPEIQQSTYYDRTFPSTTDIWTRQWLRFEGPNGSGSFTFGPTSSKHSIVYGGSPGFGAWLINNFGSRTFGLTLINYPTIDGAANFNSSGSFNDYQWYCIELHINRGTAGVANGDIQLYQDGTLVMNLTNLAIESTQTTCPAGTTCAGQTVSHSFTTYRHFGQHGSGDRYIDDIAVGNTRIGCAGGPPPPTDTTPPGPVTGLQATAGNAQVSLSGFVCTDDQGVGVYNVQQATASGGPFSTIVQIGAGGVSNPAPGSYLNTGLTNGTTYYYRVNCQDTSGNQGLYSATVSATPSAPSGGGGAVTNPVLTVTAGARFALNGVPTFLIGMAYYDGSNYHTSDIDSLAAAGFNLLHIHLDDVFRVDANSFYNSDGTAKAAKVTAFQNLITYAGTKGMVVDINCLYADVDGTNSAVLLATTAARSTAITSCINTFKANSNVFFSLVNEHNYGSFADTHAEMQTFMTTARAACPACIITYSSSDNFGPSGGISGHIWDPRTGTTVRNSPSNYALEELAQGINVLMPHDDRNTGWNSLVTPRYSNLRAMMNTNGYAHVPILMEEPAGEGSGTPGALGSASAWVTAYQDAKAAGVAGIVYLAYSSFDLNPSSLFSQLTAVELQLVNTLAAGLSSSSSVTRAAATITDNFNRSAGGGASIGVKAVKSDSSGTAHTTAGIATTSGSTMVACVSYTDGDTMAMSDSGGHTWTQIGSDLTGASAGRFRMYYAQNITGSGTHTFTATSNNSNPANLIVQELKGVLTASVLDQQGGQADSSTPFTSPSITTLHADEVLVACGQANTDPASITHTAGNSFTLQSEVTDATQYWVSHLSTRIVSSIAAYNSSTTMAGGTINSTSQQIASFKASAASGLGTNYSTGYTDTVPPTITSNQVIGTSTSFDNVAVYNATSLANNQWGSIDLAAFGGGTFGVADLLLRCSDLPTPTCYGFRAFKNDNIFGGQTSMIYKINGYGSNFVVLAQSSTATWAATDTIIGEAIGSTLNLYREVGGVETLILTATDSAISSGKCGLSTFDFTLANTQVDNLACGEFTTAAPITVPVITSVTTTSSGLTYTYTGSLAGISVGTDSGTTIYTLAQTPGGVLSRTWTAGETFVCVFAVDPNGVVNTVSNEYICKPLTTPDTTPPVISNGQPTGTLVAGTTSVSITAQTNEPAFCRISAVAGTLFADSTPMNTVDGSNHDFTLATVNGVTYTRYIRCQDTLTNTNTSDYTITFSIADPPVIPGDTTPPIRTNGTPTGTLAAGTPAALLSLSTDEAATCKYGTTAGVAYASIASTFTTTGGTSHTQVLSVANGTTYTYYVRCIDGASNANTTDYIITWSVAGNADVTPPVVSNGQPTGTLNAGTTSVTVSWNTDETATCRLNTTDVAYGSMTLTPTLTGGQNHTYTAATSNGNTYTFYIRCTDTSSNIATTSGVVSFSVASGAPSDTTDPATITGMTGLALSSTQIRWSWATPTDNVEVAFVKLWLCEPIAGCSSSKTLWATATGPATSITISNLAGGALYVACTTAVDTSGNEGDTCSDAASVVTPPITTGDVIPPATATGLAAPTATIKYNQVILTWNIGSDTESGLLRTIIERCSGTGCTNFRTIKAVPYPTLTYTDTNVRANTTYTYRIKWVDRAFNVGGYSDEVTITTDVLPRSLRQGRGGSDH